MEAARSTGPQALQISLHGCQALPDGFCVDHVERVHFFIFLLVLPLVMVVQVPKVITRSKRECESSYRYRINIWRSSDTYLLGEE